MTQAQHFRRLTHFFSFREQKHFRFALKDMLKTLKRLLNTSTIIRLLKKSTTRHLIQDIANFITSIFPTAQAQSLHLTLRAAKKKQRNSSTRFRFSQFLQMLPMLNHLLFTRQQQLTANWVLKSLRSKTSTQTQSDFQSVQSISTTLLPTLTKHLKLLRLTHK